MANAEDAHLGFMAPLFGRVKKILFPIAEAPCPSATKLEVAEEEVYRGNIRGESPSSSSKHRFKNRNKSRARAQLAAATSSLASIAVESVPNGKYTHHRPRHNHDGPNSDKENEEPKLSKRIGKRGQSRTLDSLSLSVVNDKANLNSREWSTKKNTQRLPGVNLMDSDCLDKGTKESRKQRRGGNCRQKSSLEKVQMDSDCFDQGTNESQNQGGGGSCQQKTSLEQGKACSRRRNAGSSCLMQLGSLNDETRYSADGSESCFPKDKKSSQSQPCLNVVIPDGVRIKQERKLRRGKTCLQKSSLEQIEQFSLHPFPQYIKEEQKFLSGKTPSHQCSLEQFRLISCQTNDAGSFCDTQVPCSLDEKSKKAEKIGCVSKDESNNSGLEAQNTCGRKKTNGNRVIDTAKPLHEERLHHAENSSHTLRSKKVGLEEGKLVFGVHDALKPIACENAFHSKHTKIMAGSHRRKLLRKAVITKHNLKRTKRYNVGSHPADASIRPSALKDQLKEVTETLFFSSCTGVDKHSTKPSSVKEEKKATIYRVSESPSQLTFRGNEIVCSPTKLTQVNGVDKQLAKELNSSLALHSVKEVVGRKETKPIPPDALVECQSRFQSPLCVYSRKQATGNLSPPAHLLRMSTASNSRIFSPASSSSSPLVGQKPRKRRDKKKTPVKIVLSFDKENKQQSPLIDKTSQGEIPSNGSPTPDSEVQLYVAALEAPKDQDATLGLCGNDDSGLMTTIDRHSVYTDFVNKESTVGSAEKCIPQSPLVAEYSFNLGRATDDPQTALAVNLDRVLARNQVVNEIPSTAENDIPKDDGTIDSCPSKKIGLTSDVVGGEEYNDGSDLLSIDGSISKSEQSFRAGGAAGGDIGERCHASAVIEVIDCRDQCSTSKSEKRTNTKEFLAIETRTCDEGLVPCATLVQLDECCVQQRSSTIDEDTCRYIHGLTAVEGELVTPCNPGSHTKNMQGRIPKASSCGDRGSAVLEVEESTPRQFKIISPPTAPGAKEALSQEGYVLSTRRSKGAIIDFEVTKPTHEQECTLQKVATNRNVQSNEVRRSRRRSQPTERLTVCWNNTSKNSKEDNDCRTEKTRRKRIGDELVWVLIGKTRHPAHELVSGDGDMVWIEWCSNGEIEEVRRSQIDYHLRSRMRCRPAYMAAASKEGGMTTKRKEETSTVKTKRNVQSSEVRRSRRRSQPIDRLTIRWKETSKCSKKESDCTIEKCPVQTNCNIQPKGFRGSRRAHPIDRLTVIWEETPINRKNNDLSIASCRHGVGVSVPSRHGSRLLEDDIDSTVSNTAALRDRPPTALKATCAPANARHVSTITTGSAATDDYLQSSDQWTNEQVVALRNAHNEVDPTSTIYWEDVSSIVKGKNSMECREKWFAMVKTPKTRPRREAKNIKRIQKGTEYSGEKIEDSKEKATPTKNDEEDDLFNSTPFRGIFNKCCFGPVSQTRHEIDCDSGSPMRLSSAGARSEYCTSEDASPLRFRKGYKGYINGLRKELRQGKTVYNFHEQYDAKDGRKKSINKHRACSGDGEIKMSGNLLADGTIEIKGPSESDLDECFESENESDEDEDI